MGGARQFKVLIEREQEYYKRLFEDYRVPILLCLLKTQIAYHRRVQLHNNFVEELTEHLLWVLVQLLLLLLLLVLIGCRNSWVPAPLLLLATSGSVSLRVLGWSESMICTTALRRTSSMMIRLLLLLDAIQVVHERQPGVAQNE